VRTGLGVMLPVGEPGGRVLDLGRRAEAAGIDELWVAEDLGLHGGVALAGALLAATSHSRVGIGIAPAAARHPAFLAMQAATLGQLYPGRFVLGVGHGMPDWMRSLGIWPASPLARLEETLRTVRSLLRGEPCHLDGSEVIVGGLRLETGPVQVPILAGVRGPRSLEVAGRAADGAILAGYAGPSYVARARGIVDGQREDRARIVASARFALDPPPGGATAVNRLRADLLHSLPALGDMVPPGALDDPDGRNLEAVGIAGPVDVLISGIAAWREAGADVVLLDPLSVDDLELVLAAFAEDSTRAKQG